MKDVFFLLRSSSKSSSIRWYDDLILRRNNIVDVLHLFFFSIFFLGPLIQHRLRWFGYVQRRSPEASVRSGVLKRADNVKSGRGRHKLTWDESVKRDLKEWNISKDLAMDRSAWRLTINVPEPWPLFVLCPLCLFTCLLVSRLFGVSSLAYPNLLGTKGYDVIVVVVVDLRTTMPLSCTIAYFSRKSLWLAEMHLLGENFGLV
jgi:hypothetical protein